MAKKKRAETDYDLGVAMPYGQGELYWRAKTAIQYADEQKEIGIACKVLLEVIDKYEWNSFAAHSGSGILSMFSEEYEEMRETVGSVQQRMENGKRVGLFERKKLCRRVKGLALELMLEDMNIRPEDKEAFAKEYSSKSYAEISIAFEHPGMDMTLWSLVRRG